MIGGKAAKLNTKSSTVNGKPPAHAFTPGKANQKAEDNRGAMVANTAYKFADAYNVKNADDV